MDPIRTPRRYPSEREDHLARYVLAVVSLMAVLVVGAQYYLDYRESEKAAAARALQMQAPPVPRVIYRCVEDDGRSHDQQTPCVFDRPRSASGPVPSPSRPNPNQSLLDQADARHAREVQSAARAQLQTNHQLPAAQARLDSRYRGYSCTELCSELGQLRTRMRSAYTAQQSEDFHARQNRLFQQMQAQDCRACP
jgi:hypothetical protein